ncbi:hypothetical protein ACC730_38490, partial [Rhizobium ruizarguesonis]
HVCKAFAKLHRLPARPLPTPSGVFSQSAFLQVIDTAFFAGLDAFTAQSDFLASACRINPPEPWNNGPVRMPGDSAAR